jgi:hypothetical protein
MAEMDTEDNFTPCHKCGTRYKYLLCDMRSNYAYCAKCFLQHDTKN